jgi:hypothetical protein
VLFFSHGPSYIFCPISVFAKTSFLDSSDFFYDLYTFTNAYKTDMNDFDSLIVRAFLHMRMAELQIYSTVFSQSQLPDSDYVILKCRQVSSNRCYSKNQFNISKRRLKGLQLIFSEQVSQRHISVEATNKRIVK